MFQNITQTFRCFKALPSYTSCLKTITVKIILQKTLISSYMKYINMQKKLEILFVNISRQKTEKTITLLNMRHHW